MISPRKLASIAAALALMAYIVWRLEPQQLWLQFHQLQPGWLLLAVVSLTLGNLASALRWNRIAGALAHTADGLAMPRGQAIRVYAQGLMLNTVLPGAIVGGDLWRSVSLNRRGISWTISGLSVILDRVFGVWALAILSLLAIGRHHELVAAAPAWFSLYVLGLAGLMCAPILPGLRLLQTWLQTRTAATTTQPPSASGLIQRGLNLLQLLITSQQLLWRMLPWSIAVQVGSIGCLWACQQAIGLDLSFSVTTALAGGLFLAAVMPASIGGFGSREAAALVLYGALGLSAQAGVASSILFGVCQMILGAIAALICPPSRSEIKALRLSGSASSSASAGAP